jgi:hypothetical protein
MLGCESLPQRIDSNQNGHSITSVQENDSNVKTISFDITEKMPPSTLPQLFKLKKGIIETISIPVYKNAAVAIEYTEKCVSSANELTEGNVVLVVEFPCAGELDIKQFYYNGGFEILPNNQIHFFLTNSGYVGETTVPVYLSKPINPPSNTDPTYLQQYMQNFRLKRVSNVLGFKVEFTH